MFFDRLQSKPSLDSRVECVFLKRRSSVIKNNPDGQSCGNFETNVLQQFQIIEIGHMSSLSGTIYAENNSGRFPASSEQHTDSTYVIPGSPARATYLAPHSRQAKLALILNRRHTTTDIWVGGQALGCLGCSLPLFTCHHVDACSYECGRNMSEC